MPVWHKSGAGNQRGYKTRMSGHSKNAMDGAPRGAPLLSRGKSLSGHQRATRLGETDEWLTPRSILDKLGGFDLDPCAPITRPWPTAAQHFTAEDDGLLHVWFGRVWCNPPFGREAVKWLRRCAQHGNAIALVPARTETLWFYETVWGVADAVCFLRGRPTFHRVDGSLGPSNSGAPIALIAYGATNAQVLRDSGLGQVVAAR